MLCACAPADCVPLINSTLIIQILLFTILITRFLLRSSLKILRCASYFQLSLRCLEMWLKHGLSCVTYYIQQGFKTKGQHIFKHREEIWKTGNFWQALSNEINYRQLQIVLWWDIWKFLLVFKTKSHSVISHFWNAKMYLIISNSLVVEVAVSSSSLTAYLSRTTWTVP